MKEIINKISKNNEIVCIVGLGYVGMPLTYGFAKVGINTIGYHYRQEKINDLKNGLDSTNEVSKEQLKDIIDKGNIEFTANPNDITKADFIIITVPTPVTKEKNPDISPVINATHTVAKYMRRGAVVVYESTVYPGLTEELCLPILEEDSGLKLGNDFHLGYSPERVNPGDKEHTTFKIKKVVSGYNAETGDILRSLYSKIIDAGVYVAKDIKTAEAAKVIENTQRDLNIALINELSIIFKKMDIDIYDVVDAASTKWNFHKYNPGLVGGHCIPVDPYYLLYKSEQMGYHPQIITAGRKINDEMPLYLFNLIQKEYNKLKKVINESKVLFLGLTFKENINDLRNTQARDLIELFREYGADIYGYEPNVDSKAIKKKFDIKSVDELEKGAYDCILITVAHNEFYDIDFDSLCNGDSFFVDIRGILNKAKINNRILSLGKDI